MRGTLDTWDPLFLDELAKSNRVITVDYPGVGYSEGELPAGHWSGGELRRGSPMRLALERFVLLGWSWGGTVAQTFLVEHPGRATHVVLIGTAPPGKGGVPIQQAFLERAFKPVNDLDDEIVLFFEPDSVTSRAAAKASHDRIYARPGVAEHDSFDAREDSGLSQGRGDLSRRRRGPPGEADDDAHADADHQRRQRHQHGGRELVRAEGPDSERAPDRVSGDRATRPSTSIRNSPPRRSPCSSGLPSGRPRSLP